MTHKLAKHLLKYSVAAKLHTHHTKKLHFISTVYLVKDNCHQDSYSLKRLFVTVYTTTNICSYDQ